MYGIFFCPVRAAELSFLGDFLYPEPAPSPVPKFPETLALRNLVKGNLALKIPLDSYVDHKVYTIF